MRREARLCAVFLAMVVPVMMTMRPHAAAAQADIQFGIQPANSRTDDATKGAYFSYTMAPGESVNDTAIITNSGVNTVKLKLYAADGVTAIGGGTAFAADGERRFGVLSWLTTTASSQLDVGPGERVIVPFAVRVPADATAGDHVGGWVVEAPPRAGSAGGVQTSVTERAGVAVVVRVPGETTGELALADVCLNQETGSNYVQVSVANAGNALTKAAGELRLVARGGQEIANVPFDVGTVLPADGTYVRVALPVDPEPGEYVASVSLRQADGREARAESKIKIGSTKANGCATLSDVSPATAVARRPPSAALPSDSGGPPWLTIALGGLAGLFALLFGLSLRRRAERPSDAK